MSDLGKMSNDSDSKGDSPCCPDVETSATEDDTGNQSGSICERRRVHCKDAVSIGDKDKSFGFIGTFVIDHNYSTKLRRNQAVLIDDQSSDIFLYPSEYFNPRAARMRNLALLRTCKTIHAEAGAILYGQKLFFVSFHALQNFLASRSSYQIGLLRHVLFGIDSINCRPHLRCMIPSLFALLADADSLETLVLDIHRFDAATFNTRYGMLTGEIVNVAGWDAVVGRNMAAEVYHYLSTYLRRAVAVRGIDKVMDVLDVFRPIFRDGPDNLQIHYPPRNVKGVEWTEERKVAMKKAMGEEIERLLKQGKIHGTALGI